MPASNHRTMEPRARTLSGSGTIPRARRFSSQDRCASLTRPTRNSAPKSSERIASHHSPAIVIPGKALPINRGAALSGASFGKEQQPRPRSGGIIIRSCCGAKGKRRQPVDFTAKVDDGGSDASTVRAVRLDDALQLSGHRIALKIDIEGHELAALEGMKGLLRDNDCFLQVESWPWNAQAFIADMCAEDYQLVHQIDSDYYFAPKRASRSDSAVW
jgi:hypothetical protein